MCKGGGKAKSAVAGGIAAAQTGGVPSPGASQVSMIPPGTAGAGSSAGVGAAAAQGGAQQMIPPASGTNFGGAQGFYSSAAGKARGSSSKVVLALLGVSIAFLS